MKYLFLDIDGVLNHEEWYRNRVNIYKIFHKYWWEDCFDPECVKRINIILQETGARLVVSSSWRLDMDLKKYFGTVGIPTDFDITVRDITLSNGAGFIVAYTGKIITMPGLPAVPQAKKMGLDKDGLPYGVM